jgi:putative ABC transport system permease protein
VNLATLGLRNALWRNKTRSLLTILGTTMATVAFLFLRTVLGAWYASSESSSSDRVITRNAISLTQPIPISYVDRIRRIPGVTAATYSNWFGGIYKDRKNFFAQLAIDPKTATDVYEIQYKEGTREAFEQDRNGCVVGVALAEKYGFKVGDTIPLQGDIYPGDWRFTVRGITFADNDATIKNTLFFHWARLNEGLPELRKNRIGIVTSKIARPNDSPQVIRAIDEAFANSEYETHSETEKAFRLSFVSGSGAILSALQAVSGVILVIMALILGNTLAMGVRERTPELGAMRAIGFLPRHVALLAVFEGALLGLLGGACGLLASRPLLEGFGRAMSNLGFLSGIGLRPGLALLTLSVSLSVGALAAAFPAWSAARLGVVDALRRQE